MCGRYNLRVTARDLEEFFDLFPPEDFGWTPRYNIAPTQSVPAVRLNSEGERELTLLRWGLIPSWAKDMKIGSRMINARGDTVADKPAFRAAYKRRRCLIPATGFYEWRRAGKSKEPFHIHREDDGLFCFAGLWERWEQGNDSIESCTIITTDANEQLQSLHDRMPVILPRDAYDLWLDPAIDPPAVKNLLIPYPNDDLKTNPVNQVVNSSRNETPECVERAREP